MKRILNKLKRWFVQFRLIFSLNKNKLIQPNDLKVVNTMLYELTCLRRWSEVTVEAGKYTELGKQALNCFISFILGIEAQNMGQVVDFTKFPKIAIVRGFTKTYQCDVPEQNLEEIITLGKKLLADMFQQLIKDLDLQIEDFNKLPELAAISDFIEMYQCNFSGQNPEEIFILDNTSKESFAEMILQEIKNSTSEEFYKFLQVDPDSIELRIYKAATKIGTLLELEDIKNGINASNYSSKEIQLLDNLEEYADLPGFSKVISEYTKIFRDYSLLRNRIRWAKHPNIIKCSVLGHLFDTAVFAYLMSLEKNPLDEELATHYFFMGIFHDFPERWTGDIPSPIKELRKWLRHATELFENKVMEKNVYSILPSYQANAIRKVMLEDKNNEEYKKALKQADYFSAFVECWREIDAGSNHLYYFDVIMRDYSTKKKLPNNFQKLMTKLFKAVRRHR